MAALFDPFIDRSIRDHKVSQAYAEKVVVVNVQHRTERQEYVSNALPQQRLYQLILIFVVGGCLVLGRLIYVQLLRGDNYLALAEGNRIRIEYLAAARGLIYDRHHEALVKNVPNFVIAITPRDLPRDPAAKSSVIQTTAALLAVNSTALQAQVDDHAKKLYSQPQTLREFIPYEEALSLATRVQHLPGVAVTAQAARDYQTEPAFSHVLGYLGKVSAEDLSSRQADTLLLSDVIGKTGIEYSYDSKLRGVPGKRSLEINAVGTATEIVAEEPATVGVNVVLSLDADLQRSLYQALDDLVTRRQLPGGAAVALDPSTGQILALVSYPGFDNNAFAHGISTEEYDALLADERKPLFNKAISGEYPSGSTFKLIIAAAALQEGVVTPETTVVSTGGIMIDRLFPDWKAGGHGNTDIYKALAESVNTYFYLAGGGSYDQATRTITGGLGIDRIYSYAQLFGLSAPTGIDLPAEANGFVPTPAWKEQTKGEPWYIGDTYHVAIGQGDLLLTPIQLAVYTAAIANNGIVYQPSLVDYTTDQTGHIVQDFEPVILHQGFVDADYLAVVRAGMRQAVVSGSAQRMQALPVTSAGKTGTAQIAGTDRTHSWYTTFAPYDDPEIVLAVLVEEGGEGTEAALPIAQQVLTEYFSR